MVHHDGADAHAGHAAPAQPPMKSDTATPKLNSEVELGSLPSEAHNDIMQMARVGDVAGMEKLFAAGEYDATYSDDEGITPLHVGLTISYTLTPTPC